MAEPKQLPRSVALRGPVKPDPFVDLDEVLHSEAPVGEEIKQLRKASDVTLTQMSEATGLSQGYLSQVERGISSPSIKALHTISRALGVSISWFFRHNEAGEDDLSELVVRAGNRRRLDFESGITDELLSPNLAREIELLRCTFAPGSWSGQEDYNHKGEEAGIVLSGCLTLWLDGKRIELNAGDSFAFESTTPHRYANEGEVEAVIIWALTPPTY